MMDLYSNVYGIGRMVGSVFSCNDSHGGV